MIFIKTVISFLKDDKYRDLLITSALILALGTVVYHILEGWTWVDALYFSVITLTTIGYGDFSPTTDGGKLFTIFYIFIGLGMILTFINAVYYHYAEMKGKENEKKGRS
jgi:voltage-gated potassium channel